MNLYRASKGPLLPFTRFKIKSVTPTNLTEKKKSSLTKQLQDATATKTTGIVVATRNLIYFLNMIKPKPKSLIIIFKQYGAPFRRRRQSHRHLMRLRSLIMKWLMFSKIKVSLLADRSAIPFNGCKIKKRRRKRVRRGYQLKKSII